MNKAGSNGSDGHTVTSQGLGVAEEEMTYESALRREGIDEVFVARKLKELLRAQERRWNPKKESWEKFDDHGTQLAALREIAKILDIYPAQVDAENSSKILHVDISSIPRRRNLVGPSIPDRQQDSGK
jgi:hypothetical protein